MSYTDLTSRLAGRLEALRRDHGWTLAQLATHSGVSRATLSRLENGEVSPTADVLSRLCAAYEIPMSRLLMMVEEGFTPLVPLEAQKEWTDPGTGFTRRSVSPMAGPLQAEVLECHLPPDTTLDYETPPAPGQEHHLILLDGALTMSIEGTVHDLTPGDCLRYKLEGKSVFQTGTDRGARYLLVLV